jgi:hypothetical protein
MSPGTHRTPLTKKKAPQRVCDYQRGAVLRMLEIYPPVLKMVSNTGFWHVIEVLQNQRSVKEPPVPP